MLACNLNYINNEMKAVISPADSRNRGDARLFEEGREVDADEEKVRVEIK